MNNSFFDHIRQVRLLVALAVAFVLFALCDIGVRRLERFPNLALGNHRRSHAFTPYFFEQISHTKDRPAVAWFGASVVEGFNNAPPELCAPVRTQGLLEAHGYPTRAFNFAVVQNSMGDLLGLMTEAAGRGADLLIMPLHLKAFSDRGIMGSTSLHKDTCFYLRHRPDFTNLRRNTLHITDREWNEIRIRKNLERIWAYYRERGLITYMLTGHPEPPPHQFREWFATTIAGDNEILQEYGKKPDYEKRNEKYIWRGVKRIYQEENRKYYGELDLRYENMHFVLFEMINRISRDSNVKLLFYATPLNRNMNNIFHFWPWQKHTKFIEMVRSVIERNGNIFVDLTDAVSSAEFTDADHLTIDGHDQLSRALYPHILKALQEGGGS